MREETLKGPDRDKGLREEDDGHGLGRMTTFHLVLEGLIHSTGTCGCLIYSRHCVNC